jgi:hypothetical protein
MIFLTDATGQDPVDWHTQWLIAKDAYEASQRHIEELEAAVAALQEALAEREKRFETAFRVATARSTMLEAMVTQAQADFATERQAWSTKEASMQEELRARLAIVTELQKDVGHWMMASSSYVVICICMHAYIYHRSIIFDVVSRP